MKWLDIVVILTFAFFAFNGWRNGAIISIANLLSLPIGYFVALTYGGVIGSRIEQFGIPDAGIFGFPITFFITVAIVHFAALFLRQLLHSIVIFGVADNAVGAGVGFVEAWVLWLALLFFLRSGLTLPSTNLNQQTLNNLPQLQSSYNQLVQSSYFAQIQQVILQPIAQQQTK